MGGMFSKPKKPNTAKFVERPGVALLKDLPSYTESAQKATAARLAEIERVMPGATQERKMALANLAQDRQRLDEMGAITGAMMRGELPKDVQEQTMRNIAEYGGAGFNPATAGRAGGFQMAQGMVPRQYGLQSLQLQQQGLGYEQQRIQQKQQLQSTAMGWQQLADSFAYDPFEAAQFAGPSQRYGESKSGAAAKDEATYQQAVATQQKNIMGAVTGVAAIAAAPFLAPALFGGLASGAAALGLGTAGTAATAGAAGTMGTGLAGSLFNIGASRVGTGLAAGAAIPAISSIYGGR